MRILLKDQFEFLKKQVIANAGLTSITPADCKRLSLLISNKTRKCVSETTLKRIYGFALSNFQPSLFTLDALAQFCSYDGTSDLLKKTAEGGFDHGEVSTSGFSWHTLKQNADKITGFTLQALKNRSGIPFRQTIKRDFVDQFINDFDKSGLTAALISAPAGYGKTIGLCHWVEEKINAVNSNDILLFFSSTALMSILYTGMDINNWLQMLLGYCAFGKIKNMRSDNGGVFYLVIDGLDDSRMKEDQFDLILNQLKDVVSVYSETTKFKLILTMRTTTWQNYRHQLADENHTWFTGFGATSELINVPLFSMDEIRTLSAKINPATEIPVQLSETLKCPLYFQLFYKENKAEFSFGNINHTSAYELYALYLNNQIYPGKYSAEKILIIDVLIDAICFEDDHYRVDKLKVTEVLNIYHHAYAELLNAGILSEASEKIGYQYKVYIKFVNNYFLTHSMAKALLNGNGDLFNADLIKKINIDFAKCQQKLAILKYCIIQTIKRGQQIHFEELFEMNLNMAEKNDLMVFFDDLLSKDLPSKGSPARLQHFNQGFDNKLFDCLLASN